MSTESLRKTHIPKLVIETNFYGEQRQRIFYDVALADVELYQARRDGTEGWYIRVRGNDYNLCPVPEHIIVKASRDRAVNVLTHVKNQLDGLYDKIEKCKCNE